MNRLHRLSSLAAGLAISCTTAAVLVVAPTATGHEGRQVAGTLGVSDATPTVGDRISLKGHIRPFTPHSQAVLQVRYDNRKTWKSLDSDRVNRSGHYRFSETIKTGRTRKYRVVEAGAEGQSARTSKTVTVVAYAWKPLDAFAAPNNTRWFLTDGTVAINGASYPRSAGAYAGSASGSVDVNLSRDCTLLDATYGLDDRSATASTATIAVAVDGVPAYGQTVGLTQGQRVRNDVTDAFRVTLSYTETAGAIAVAGSPMALCHD